MNIKTLVSLLIIVTVCSYDACGCPPFPADCRTECTTADNNGCFVCNCIYLVNEGNNQPAGVVGNGCPVFPSDCLPSCTSMDDKGCIVCTCLNAVPTTKTTTTTTTTTPMPPTLTPRDRLCNVGGYLLPCKATMSPFQTTRIRLCNVGGVLQPCY